MTRNDIIKQVNSLLAEEFETEESLFEPNALMKEVLELDSINLVDLVALVKFTYKIVIPAADLPKLQTFNDLYDYIEQHMPQE
jgi:acyl carrier protein